MDPIYRLSLDVPLAAQAAIEEALEFFGGALASDLIEGRGPGEGRARLQLYLGDDPGRPAVTARLAVAALAAGIPTPAFTLELMPEIDWVAESQAALPPIVAGRFYVYGSHVATPLPPALIPLLIDANIAFGTGRHETTRGCLVALSALAQRERPRRVLDLGCGSGILALAARKLWRQARIVASDIDPDSVRVTAENARLNGEPGQIAALRSVGYANAALEREAPYDLIIANILARPLCQLATETARHLLPGGRVILSGLLTWQERQVLARHRAAGLVLERRYRFGDWSTLMLRRPAVPSACAA